MTTVIVQSAPASGANTGISRNFSTAATVGNSLIAWLHHTASTTDTMTGAIDNASNAFTQDYTAVDSLTSDGIRIYRRTNIGNAATSYTPQAGVATGVYGGLVEVSGMDNSAPYVGTTYVSNAPTTSHSVSFTTTTANAIIVVGIRTTSNLGTISSLPANWGNVGLARTSASMLYCSDVGAAGAKTLTFTSSNSGSGAALHYYVAEYKAAVTDPSVTSVTSTATPEGSATVHTVTLSGPTNRDTAYAYSWGTATATSADYTQTLTTAMCARTGGASGDVTVSGTNITAETGVSAFTITVPTTQDALDEDNETIVLTVGGTASTGGSITDDDAPPSITITPSITVDQGDSVVLTCTLGAVSGRVTQARLVLADGTKVGGVDYTNVITNGMLSDGVTISAGVLSIPAGVGSFTIAIPTTP